MSKLFPTEILDSHIAILGKTGSGKSNVAKVMAEALMHNGERVCVIDPTGTWWGLRLDAGGKRASSLRPVIFGGEHADIPIAEQHGAVIAEAIGTSSDSAIIDTRQMSTSARTRFFTTFAETLLRTNKGPLHLIVDEAHLFAPQGKVNSPQAGAMLAEANELVSRGRSAGLRVILISQRPAKLHKDSLTQAETLIAMRLIAPQDRAAIEAWVGEWADPGKGREIIASLPGLPVGDAWVWAPALDHLKRTHFPLASTFDSGRPLGRDEAAPLLTPLDQSALGDKMDTIRQQAMENDPARLKARLRELERERELERANPLKVVDQDALDAARLEGYNEGASQGYMAGYGDATKKVLDLAAALATDIGAEPPVAPWPNGKAPAFDAGTAGSSPAGATKLIRPVPDERAVGASRASRENVLNTGIASPRQAVGGDGVALHSIAHRHADDPPNVSPSSVKLVDAIVAAYPAGMSLETAAKRAGLSKRSSAFNRYLREAAASPRIQRREDGRYVAVAAEAGLVPPRGLDDFKRGLQPSYARILEAIENSPVPITKAVVAEESGVSPTSSGLGAGLKELLALGLIEERSSGYVLHPDFT